MHSLPHYGLARSVHHGLIEATKSILANTLRLKTFMSHTQLYSTGLRELKALQLQKTHENRKSTSKLRKHLHHFDGTYAANAHNTKRNAQVSQTTLKLPQQNEK